MDVWLRTVSWTNIPWKAGSEKLVYHVNRDATWLGGSLCDPGSQDESSYAGLDFWSVKRAIRIHTGSSREERTKHYDEMFIGRTEEEEDVQDGCQRKEQRKENDREEKEETK